MATWRNYHKSICSSKPKEPGIPFEIKTLPRLNCDSDKEFILEYIRNVISFSGGAAPGSRIIEHIAGISDGNPRYMIYGINLVLEGKDIFNLADAESVLGSSYSLIFNKLIKDHGEQVFESYIKLALIGAAGASELEMEEIDKKIKNFEKHRQILVQDGYLFFNEEEKIFLVDPDLLRIYVTRLFISNNTDSPLWSENPVRKMRRFIRPFLPCWLRRILPLLNSLEDNEKSAEIKRAFLEDAGEEIDKNKTADEKRLEGWMISLAAAHWIERDNEDRKPVLKLLEKTANKTASPSAELDRIWAMVMVNEAAVETDPGKRLKIAREIAAVANRHTRPVPEIDTEWARALANYALSRGDSDINLETAERIKKESSAR